MLGACLVHEPSTESLHQTTCKEDEKAIGRYRELFYRKKQQIAEHIKKLTVLAFNRHFKTDKKDINKLNIKAQDKCFEKFYKFDFRLKSRNKAIFINAELLPTRRTE